MAESISTALHEEDKPVMLAGTEGEQTVIPFSAFPLSIEPGRLGFLQQLYAIGFDALFEGVAHVWDSLAEPREERGRLMGVASGVGGSGKVAVYWTLHQFIEQGLASIEPLPAREDFDSFDAWSAAALATFSIDEQRIAGLCRAYSRILDGNADGQAVPTMIV